MKSVLVRLSEYGERGAQMSAAEAGVVRFVREQPEEAADLSIHLLAQRTFSSPSTIVRMCHRLGFDGYKEFRRTLQYELAVRGHGCKIARFILVAILAPQKAPTKRGRRLLRQRCEGFVVWH